MDPAKSVIDYYDTCESDYRLFWDLDHSLAMHAGYWDDTTNNLREALARENEIMAQIAGITSSDTILDAGCGVGGSCIFLAKHYGCHATGITLSSKQVNSATLSAKKYGVEDLVNFQMQDFCKTTFPDESFDVIWGLESVCHAPNKNKFIQEAYRLLKQGGRIIITDGFALHNNYSPKDAKHMSKWLKGWGVESLETLTTFKDQMKSNHFKNINCLDVTDHVLPSSKRLYWLSFPAILFSKAGEYLNLRNQKQTENIVAAYYQYTTLKNKLWTYSIFSATKNKDL